jgi:hypothetical protein
VFRTTTKKTPLFYKVRISAAQSKGEEGLKLQAVATIRRRGS